MNQVVSEQLIGDLLERAHGSASAVRAAPQAQEIAAVDFRQSQELPRSVATSLSVLQEAYARRLSKALEETLRVTVEAAPSSVERVSYSDFVNRIPNPTYLGLYRIPSLDSTGLVQIELPLVFQMLDLTLGGFGAVDYGNRNLTEIEDEIFRPLAQLLCQQLQAAWKPLLDFDCSFDKSVANARSANVLPGSEKLLLLTFDVAIAEGKSKITLALPSAVTNRLFRELSAHATAAEPVVSQKNRARIQEILLDSRFDIELVLPGGTISVGEVFALHPGSVVALQTRVDEPIHLRVAGRTMFAAAPARCGTRRAAEVIKALSISSEKEGI